MLVMPGLELIISLGIRKTLLTLVDFDIVEINVSIKLCWAFK